MMADTNSSCITLYNGYKMPVLVFGTWFGSADFQVLKLLLFTFIFTVPFIGIPEIYLQYTEFVTKIGLYLSSTAT